MQGMGEPLWSRFPTTEYCSLLDSGISILVCSPSLPPTSETAQVGDLCMKEAYMFTLGDQGHPGECRKISSTQEPYICLAQSLSPQKKGWLSTCLLVGFFSPVKGEHLPNPSPK